MESTYMTGRLIGRNLRYIKMIAFGHITTVISHVDFVTLASKKMEEK